MNDRLNSLLDGTVTPLNRKALLVTLTISKPATSRRDASAEEFLQNQLQDTALRVNSQIFRDKTSPVRVILNEANAIYAYHKEHTLAWRDRGARLLPIDAYESYNKAMRDLRSALDSKLATHMPAYDQLVAEDMARRGPRASLNDYPTRAEFEAGLRLKFYFEPLPDASHFLFDINEDDRNELEERIRVAEDGARKELFTRMHTPLIHLTKKLAVPIGSEGSIFRDSAVENIAEACDQVEALAMGDEEVLAAVAEVRRGVVPFIKGVNVLRESPIVREQAAEKLKAVADKMAFMFGE